MCLVALCSAAGLIVIGAGESARLGVALLPVVAGIIIGVITIART